MAALAAQGAPPAATVVDVQILAINDFHGALEPPAGGNGRIGSVAAAGGIEYLASHLARLKATNRNTVIVSAGDNIGGTPLLSSLFHDEGSVEALNIAGLQISAVGNHDLDEGWWELYRMVKGGCHPVDGCQDGTPYDGATFTYLSANITLDPAKADPAQTRERRRERHTAASAFHAVDREGVRRRPRRLHRSHGARRADDHRAALHKGAHVSAGGRRRRTPRRSSFESAASAPWSC